MLAAMQCLPDALAYRSRHHPVTVLRLRLFDLACKPNGSCSRLRCVASASIDGKVDHQVTAEELHFTGIADWIDHRKVPA